MQTTVLLCLLGHIDRRDYPRSLNRILKIKLSRNTTALEQGSRLTFSLKLRILGTVKVKKAG